MNKLLICNECGYETTENLLTLSILGAEYCPQCGEHGCLEQEGDTVNTTERPPILNECHVCGEPHTLTRMVHKWDYSYCLTCWQTIDTIVTDFNKEMETK